MTPDQEFIKHILCLHCERNMGLSEEWRGEGACAGLVRCGRDGCWTYRHLRTKCPGYKADCQSQPEPCNGDCEKMTFVSADDILCFRCERCRVVFRRYSRGRRRNDTAEPLVHCKEPNGDEVVCHLKVECPFWKKKESET